ncbi:peptidase [Kribbella sp.]|uniref:peptidase n=1 Tax=Kribbella sp. TaxID=1871183 RepID=UPI002D4D7A12|nr:peptidase [Kribbella sp.]HZX02119.1 peptidase [Kribbella sp.]
MYKPGKIGVGVGPGLAMTGANYGWWISLAIALVLAGTLMVLFAVRRRRLARADVS